MYTSFKVHNLVNTLTQEICHPFFCIQRNYGRANRSNYNFEQKGQKYMTF